MSPWQFPQETVAATDVHAALGRWQLGDPAGFGELIRYAQARADRLPFPHGPFTMAYALSYQALVLNEMGRFDRAESGGDRLQRLADTHGFAFWTMAASMAAAITASRRQLVSDHPDENVLAEQAEQLAGIVLLQRMVDTLLLVPYALTNQAMCVGAIGEHDRALALLDEALEVADQTGSAFYSAETHRVRSEVLRSAGAPRDVSLEALGTAVVLASRQHSIPFEIRARAALGEYGIDDARLLDLLADPGSALSAGPIGRPLGHDLNRSADPSGH